jgi:hypothetical protein
LHARNPEATDLVGIQEGSLHATRAGGRCGKEVMRDGWGGLDGELILAEDTALLGPRRDGDFGVARAATAAAKRVAQ